MAEWQRKPIQTGARATPPISPNNVFLTTQVDGSLSKANLTVALDSKISGVSQSAVRMRGKRQSAMC